MTIKEALERLASENVRRSIETVILLIWLSVITIFFVYRDFKQQKAIDKIQQNIKTKSNF